MRLTLPLHRVAKMTKEYSNLPERYINRAMAQVEWKTPPGPQYLRKVIQKTSFRYTLDRPWTEEFRRANRPGKIYTPICVQPLKDWNFFRGDRVEVLVGKDKGKQGIVNYIVQERNWVVVEGLNCFYKNIGERGKFPGIVMKTEAPLLVTTEVSLVDPSDNKPTKVEWRYTEEGDRVRVSSRTGRVIPLPIMAEETMDYKTKATYNEQPKDTTTKELQKITFDPSVKTFEMDIMDHMGIKEDRIPQKTYWY